MGIYVNGRYYPDLNERGVPQAPVAPQPITAPPPEDELLNTAAGIAGTYAGEQLPTWMGLTAEASAGSPGTIALAAPEAPTLIPGAGQTVVPGTGAGAAAGPWSLSGVGGAGNFILPAAGAVGALDLLSNDYSDGRSALQGAASGAAIGSYFGPVGAVIGGGAGGLLGLGKSFLSRKPTTEVEEGRWRELLKRGAISEIPGFVQPTSDPNAWFRPDLAPDFVGMDGGGWVNNKFAMSRAEGDLRPEDIWGYADFVEEMPDWLQMSEEQRRKIASEALAKGLVDEHHGTVDVNWTPELREFVKRTRGGL